jgi:adenine-specific DNA-methyltransferase
MPIEVIRPAKRRGRPASAGAGTTRAGEAGAGIRYLGSKARIAGEIVRIIGAPDGPDAVFVDGFAGTGAVGREAARRGWPVRLNDHLLCSTILAAGTLVSVTEARFADFGGYAATLRLLNACAPVQGFIWREYSPASRAFAPVTRTYFTEENAAFIDGVRRTIQLWSDKGLLSPQEERLLVADLLVTASKVANTAGTFGCFLRKWAANALQPASLKPRELLAAGTRTELFNTDVALVPVGGGDVAYFDPPYTKRQYAAYYHVLETIAHGDEPTVEGVTGLRPWREKASDFCYRARALKAITHLVTRCPARRVYLSYSSEGHVELPALRKALGAFGRLTVHTLGDIARYAPNTEARLGASTVTEYLLEFTRNPSGLRT